MHGLWQQRRDAPASKLGRRASRISAISRIGASGMAAARWPYRQKLRRRGLAGRA
jgi:hypothetical protein